MLVSPIEEFLKQPNVAKIVQTTIDNTIQQYAELSSPLNTYCPMVYTENLSDDEQIESHVKSQKAGVAYQWDKETQNSLKLSLELAVLKSVPLQNILDTDGKLVVGINNDLVKVIVGTVVSSVRSHLNLLSYLAWQKLQNGFPILFEFDWTSTNTANALRDLGIAHTHYKHAKGRGADAMAISKRLLEKISRLATTQKAVTCNEPDFYSPVSSQELSTALSLRGLPDFVVVEDVVEMPNEEGTPTMTRFLNENTIVFLSKQHGFKRVLGGTLEANGHGGIYVRTYTKEDGTAVTNTVSRPSVLSSSFSFAVKVKS
jgi:hypothetical protein